LNVVAIHVAPTKYSSNLVGHLSPLLQVKKAKNFQAGMQMIRQLYFGAMDMHLHSNTYNPNGDKTVFQVLFCAYLRICVWWCLVQVVGI
jgi:hypothetical protein